VSETKAASIANPTAGDLASLEIAPLETFVRQHYPRLVRLAGLITRDPDQAQDAVQAALERASQKRSAVRGGNGHH
jgi:DNA-directed RNA polymerase specialized sigma24 family protein